MRNTRSVSSTESRPLRSSWVDLLIVAIDRLPGPVWVFYLVATTIFLIGNAGLRWIDGSQPLGTLDPAVTIFSLLTVYGLAVVHYLQRAARRSLAAFRPALGELEPEYSELERRLTTMPVSASVAAVALALAIQAVGVLNSPNGWGITQQTSLWTDAFTLVQEALFGIFLMVFVFRAVRQLWQIVRIHRGATNINLYDSEPNNAFSRLTLPTSIGVTVPYAIAEVLSATASGISVFEVVLLILLVVISITLFVLPLYGMHRRLLQEREQMVSTINRRFEVAARSLHELVDAGEYAEVSGPNTAMSALVLEGERVKKLSTWPWRGETLSRFLSSIALPVVLWAITTILGRLFA